MSMTLQVTKEHRERAKRREKEAKAKAKAIEETPETDENAAKDGTDLDTKAKQKSKQSR